MYVFKFVLSLTQMYRQTKYTDFVFMYCRSSDPLNVGILGCKRRVWTESNRGRAESTPLLDCNGMWSLVGGLG